MSLLQQLDAAAHATVQSGYYGRAEVLREAPSFVEAIATARARHDPALILEVAPATSFNARMPKGGLELVMRTALAEGACALSVTTEPTHHGGSLALLRKAVATRVPVLMNDIIVDESQIDCAAREGASAVLLLGPLHGPKRLNELVDYAHMAGREAVWACHTEREFELASAGTADAVAILNRDPHDAKLDVSNSIRLLSRGRAAKPTLSIGGFATRSQLAGLRGLIDAAVAGREVVEGRVSAAQLLGYAPETSPKRTASPAKF